MVRYRTKQNPLPVYAAGIAFFWAPLAFGQYNGPAILSRGEAPAAMTQSIPFRVFGQVAGVYDTGLVNASLTEGGQLAAGAGAGVRIAGGVSGSRAWKHTSVGLDYRGTFTNRSTGRTSVSYRHSLLLGVTRRLTRRITVDFRESAGIFTRDFGVAGLHQTVPFDPSSGFIPTTDYFDNRTIYTNTQLSATFQKSLRLSYSMNGGAFMVRRDSSSLSGVSGRVAGGDVQYRLSRSNTIGATYEYRHYGFSQTASGGSDLHFVTGTYSARPRRHVELSASAGMMRIESKFLQSARVDPLIAELLGITQQAQIIHTIANRPTVSARLSKATREGLLYVSGGVGATPGNGIFLTSHMSRILGGYSYTGARHWTVDTQAARTWGSATGAFRGNYGGVTATVSVARTLRRGVHFTSQFSVRQYQSRDYSLYNRRIYTAMIGLGFSPGELPLRIW